MQIVSIEEERQDELIVGIDFGTTHSLIGVYDGATSNLIKLQNGSYLLPSIISCNQAGQITAGTVQADNINIYSIKRFLGKTANTINEDDLLQQLGGMHLTAEASNPILKVAKNNYNLTTLASQIFKQIKQAAEIHLGQEVNSAVISVPAHFNDIERGAVVTSAKLAGIDVRRLIAEPTAAAYAYSLHKANKGCFLVYDFGGGTFDVSILNMQEGVLQVIATGGDNKLGGDDIDHEIYQQLNLSSIQEAKLLKEQLSTQDEARYSKDNKTHIISRQQLEAIIKPIINRTIKLTKSTLFDSAAPNIDGVILVGGSSRIPLIRHILQVEFPLAKIYDDINPDYAVCYGAAMQGYNLAYRQNKSSQNLLIDVVPLSLGLELYGGLVEKIIDRNTALPATETRQFTTQIDNQSAIDLNIYQGERELAIDCQKIASFELSNIPPMPAGMARVDVSFTLDNDGILSVSASEQHSGASSEVTLKPTHNLSQSEIDSKLTEAFSLAANDHSAALLIETKLEAEELCHSLLLAIEKTPNILPTEQMKDLQNAINTLQLAINGDNRQTIIEAMTELNVKAEHFIEEHLNNSAKVSLVGKKLNDI